jgi:Glycosyl transferase family 2
MTPLDLIALYGIWLIFWRYHRPLAKSGFDPPRIWPRLSVIVPARDEEHNLLSLLPSLCEQDYPNFEVIVVDDGSTDRTAAVARDFSVRLVTGKPRPDDWRGKQWACWQGASAATGEIFLFTDADTWHRPGSLRAAVAELVARGADVLTALPFHESKSWWEAVMGPFHLLLLAVTRPFAAPKPRRVFAIGQYLMFTRTGYDRIGGHYAVREDIVEDLPLANTALKAKLNYVVFLGKPLFNVRMYRSLKEFFAGWRRNFRAGFAYGHPAQSIEVTAMIAAICCILSPSPLHLAMGILVALVMASRQRQLGRFSIWGALIPFFALLLFIGITIAAVLDNACKHPIQWKGRAYNP